MSGLSACGCGNCPRLTSRNTSTGTGPDVSASVGSYKLEGEGARLFTQVQGDYFSVLGPSAPRVVGLARAQGRDYDMSNFRIPLAAVVGSPVAHSRSPALHRYWLRKYGIQGYYVPIDIAAADLGEAVASLPKLGFVGVNVTIPHKERILEFADLVTDRAALMGAANTIIFRKDGKVHADNTDGYGFIENLRQGAPDWDPKAGPAAVIGAGGAARAVVASLLDAGAPENQESATGPVVGPTHCALNSEHGYRCTTGSGPATPSMVPSPW